MSSVTLSPASIDPFGRLVIETLRVIGVAKIGMFTGFLTTIGEDNVTTD